MAVDKYKRPCIDSSVFIGGIGGEICKGIKRAVVFRYIWDKAKAGEFPVMISALALAEVYKKKKRSNLGGTALDEFLDCINEPFVEVIEVDREVGLKAHEFCGRYAANKLYPNDSIHLACALRAKCDVLLAWDTPLTNISHPDIRIEEPTIYERDLFTNEIATGEEITAYESFIAAEQRKIQKAGHKSATLKRHDLADSIADAVVSLRGDGKLPSPFTTKDIKAVLGGTFENPHLDKVLPSYCAGGNQVKLGRKARFQRVSTGHYDIL